MSKCSGIDLHSDNRVVAVIADEDLVCCQNRVPNDLAKIEALAERYRESLVDVVVAEIAMSDTVLNEKPFR